MNGEFHKDNSNCKSCKNILYWDVSLNVLFPISQHMICMSFTKICMSFTNMLLGEGKKKSCWKGPKLSYLWGKQGKIKVKTLELFLDLFVFNSNCNSFVKWSKSNMGNS